MKLSKKEWDALRGVTREHPGRDRQHAPCGHVRVGACERGARIMTPQQETAFLHPCRLGEETGHPRFVSSKYGAWSLILTLDAGYE